MWDGEVVASFEILSKNLIGEIEEDHERSQ
jgi:hypothetical protein